MKNIYGFCGAVGLAVVRRITRVPAAFLKKTPVLVALLLAASSGAWAGACSSSPLSAYLTPGFSCTETIAGDTLTFSGFKLDAGSPTGVNVTVLPYGFDFGSFAVSPGQVLDFTLAYTVSGDLDSLTLDLGKFGTTGFGAILDVGGTAIDGHFLGSVSVFDNHKKGAKGTAILKLPELGGPFRIVDNLVLSATSSVSTASLGELSNEFNMVPEPTTVLIFGTGLLIVGATLRRRWQT